MLRNAGSRLIAATFVAATAIAAGSSPLGAAVSATAGRLVTAQTALATRLISRLAANNTSANIIVSPASLAGALGVIEFGADEQLRRSLHQILGFTEGSQFSIDFDGLRKPTGRSRRGGPFLRLPM
ncbi:MULTISPECIES: serpin family protein [unclassified Bradyrhizobium]|uniref:serpin family protein n=1 Tax=unclassified Bradyrhizobium TaxID=2631580 RepID=UPI001BA847D6|nr:MULTISPECIES: serpin family protein [unclassified Bradyrhizobium]MBR1208886.1 hypothetical protein [Bradyrhizobium sp. AUGA SZCCT0124]MBR1317054.1 hypothetical protein [Bradyrhizobium sp. AUGA SZCCT0051]MBR1345212.1 hypothetical protein [Bradyrhizobium sp. AUGA SZCCT0105]MBR1360297.1 hypothetical protein [Bradyrhizobium sp. AUGA SZCCT0045]